MLSLVEQLNLALTVRTVVVEYFKMNHNDSLRLFTCCHCCVWKKCKRIAIDRCYGHDGAPPVPVHHLRGAAGTLPCAQQSQRCCLLPSAAAASQAAYSSKQTSLRSRAQCPPDVSADSGPADSRGQLDAQQSEHTTAAACRQQALISFSHACARRAGNPLAHGATVGMPIVIGSADAVHAVLPGQRAHD